jgi:hypothetical protein
MTPVGALKYPPTSREELIELMRRYDGNRVPAARELGMPVATLKSRLRAAGLQGESDCSPARIKASSKTDGKIRTGGFCLNTHRTNTTKPAGSAARALLHKLPKGKGFPLAEVADEAMVSPETLKKHAKKLGAFLYVEVSPEEWVECVKNPES